jgi:hypothetical protein
MPAIARHESVWRRSVDLQPASLLENAAVAAPFRIATELEFFLSRSDHRRVPANYSPASTQAIAATDRFAAGLSTLLPLSQEEPASDRAAQQRIHSAR